jgi:hypothetical protein
MDVFDFILFPLYVGLVYLFFRYRKKKLEDPLVQKYFVQGYWIKVAGCIAFTIFNTYVSQGDSIGVYQPEGAHIRNLIFADVNNINLLVTPATTYDETLLFDSYNAPTLKSESNFLVVRVSAIFSLFSFGKYFVTNFLFALFAYAGMWRLYKFFYEQHPSMHKELAIAILYFPTVIFWSSGAMKEALCMGGLGLLTYALYGLFIKKERPLGNSIIALLAGYLLITIKVYIVIAYLPFFTLYLLLKNVTLLKNKFFKYLMAPLLIAGCIYAYSQVINTLDEELGNYAVSNIAESVKTQQLNFEAQAESGSNFSLGTSFDGSVLGMITIGPAAIVATLFRPFLWESKKISTLLSSFESLALMFFTFYVIFKAGPGIFLRSLVKDPLIIFCFAFSVVFAVFVGATTLNFGSLVRYKIPCLPFFLITLFLILDKVKKKTALAPRIPQKSEAYL